MDCHILFKLGTHTLDSSDKQLAITSSVPVIQKQTLLIWVHFLAVMTTEHLLSSSLASHTLLNHCRMQAGPHDLMM